MVDKNPLSAKAQSTRILSVRSQTTRAMLFKMLSTQCRHGNESAETVLMVTGNEAAFIGFFPDGETRAGCTPCIHDLRVRTPLVTDPFK